MENLIKKAIAHFDKKVTDYQIYVDRALQNHKADIKTLTNYVTNTLDSHKQMILNYRYALTDEDKQSIAGIVADEIMTPLETIIDESGALE